MELWIRSCWLAVWELTNCANLTQLVLVLWFFYAKENKSGQSFNSCVQLFVIQHDAILIVVYVGLLGSQSQQWYPWSPPNSPHRFYLCTLCWIYWKKYGGLKKPGIVLCSHSLTYICICSALLVNIGSLLKPHWPTLDQLGYVHTKAVFFGFIFGDSETAVIDLRPHYYFHVSFWERRNNCVFIWIHFQKHFHIDAVLRKHSWFRQFRRIIAE